MVIESHLEAAQKFLRHSAVLHPFGPENHASLTVYSLIAEIMPSRAAREEILQLIGGQLGNPALALR